MLCRGNSSQSEIGMMGWLLLRRLLRPLLGFDRRQQIYKIFAGDPNLSWSRVVMIQEMRKLVEELTPEHLNALEISGRQWNRTSFKSYSAISYPEYDVCEGPYPGHYDLVIADQVFEHLLWPYRAGKNVYEMLVPGGYFLMSTPFLVRVHNRPTDCTRWTEVGLKYFLAECGFPLDTTRTGSWGNRACVRADLKPSGWTRFRPRRHSLVNEPVFPYHVWALAQKS